MLDFTWFDMTNLRTEEDWYNRSKHYATCFYRNATYYYSPVSGIDNLCRKLLSLSNQPLKGTEVI